LFTGAILRFLYPDHAVGECECSGREPHGASVLKGFERANARYGTHRKMLGKTRIKMDKLMRAGEHWKSPMDFPEKRRKWNSTNAKHK
jgi:hypothetical protein